MRLSGSRRRSTLLSLSAISLAPWFPLALFAQTLSTLNSLPRKALVVGNSRYRALPPLKNPANDAAALSSRLAETGFSVDRQLDTSKSVFESAIQEFVARVSKDKCVGLFYFAGHGLQLNWRNYLIPIDAILEKAEDVPRHAVDLKILLDGLSRTRNPMNIIILDACRDNPFALDLRSGKGLSQIDAPVGTMLAYATAPGNTASDGDGDNGLYTQHLLKEMRVPDAKIEDVFKRVRLNVRRASNGLQIPWESTSLEDDFHFIPPAQPEKLTKEEIDRRYAEELALWKKAESKAVTAARALQAGGGQAR